MIALKASLGHNHKYNTTLLFDSGHYMGTAQLLCQAFQAYFHNGGFNDWSKLHNYLILDGPLVPVLGSALFLFLKQTPTIDNWFTFILFESLFHALAAGLLVSLTYKLSGRPLASALTGLAWALYPAAILGSDSFLGEVPAAALVLLYMRLLVGLIETTRGLLIPLSLALVAGFTAAALFSSKPALILCLAATTVIALVLRRKAGLRAQTLMLAGLAGGASLVLGPWLAYTHGSTGEYLIAARRQPTFNASKGSDVDSDGWGMLPYSLTQKRFPEQGGAVNCLLTLWKEQPAASLNLALRKPERLWMTPWNDFHHFCLALSPRAQTWLHQLLVVLAGIGLMLLPVLLRTYKSKSARFILASAPLVILGHMAYVPFETLARYGLSAMPMFFILAAAACSFSAAGHRLKQLVLAATCGMLAVFAANFDWLPLLSILPNLWLMLGTATLLQIAALAIYLRRALAISPTYLPTVCLKGSQTLALSLGLVIGAILTAHLLYEREAREWTCTLKKGERIERRVFIDKFAGNKSLLIIDADAYIDTAKIKINGRSLQGPTENPMKLVKSWCDLERLQFMFACMHGHNIQEIRQWRALPIGDGLIKAGQENIITLEAGAPVTIYGSYDSPWGGAAYAHSFNAISTGRLLNEITGKEGRVITTAVHPRPAHCLYQGQEDLSPTLGKQSGSYKLYILESTPAPEDENGVLNVF